MEVLEGGARLGREAARRRDRVQALRHLRLPGRPHRRHLPRARRAHRRGRLRGGDGAAARARARGGHAFKAAAGLEYAGGKTEFHGYDTLALDGDGRRALPRRRAGRGARSRRRGRRRARPHAVLRRVRRPGRRPRRAASARPARSRSTTRRRSRPTCSATRARSKTGALQGRRHGSRRSVDIDARARTMRNHSATHLMHKALREVLGAHVQQKGSLVDADKTRFDFAHNAPMTDEQIREVEAAGQRRDPAEHADATRRSCRSTRRRSPAR